MNAILDWEVAIQAHFCKIFSRQSSALISQLRQ